MNDYKKLFYDVIEQILTECRPRNDFSGWQVVLNAIMTALAATRLRDALSATKQQDAVQMQKEYQDLRIVAESMLRKQLDSSINTQRRKGTSKKDISLMEQMGDHMIRSLDVPFDELSEDDKSFLRTPDAELWITAPTDYSEKCFIRRRTI